MGIDTHLKTPLAEAVRLSGGQSAFARMIGRSQSTVFDWLRFGKPLPPKHVLAVEAKTGVSRHALAPDIYPPAEAGFSSLASTAVEAGAPTDHFARGAGMKRSAGQ